MLTSYCYILCRERLPLNYRCKSMTWLSNKISAYYLDVFQSQGVAYVNCVLFMVFYLMKLINWYEHAMGGLCLMHSGIYCLHCLLYPSVGVWWNYPFFKGAHNICMCNLESTSQCYANSNRMWWRCQSLWHSIQRVSDAATYDPQLTVWTLYPIISGNIESPSKLIERAVCTAVQRTWLEMF